MMEIPQISLSWEDNLIIGLYFLFTLVVGIAMKKSAEKGLRGYFLSGQKLSWWLLGTSMVATTFALDTPLYVAAWTREFGIAQNWEWWIFVLGATFTTFFFAKLWRRTNVLNDAEFIHLRYSGKEASFLRGFRSLYMGFLMNMLVIGSQLLAISKIGTLVLGISSSSPHYEAAKWGVAIVCGLTALFYCVLSGFGAIVVTDLVQFILAMSGSIILAIFACRRPEVGGLTNMIAQLKVSMPDKLAFMPSWHAVQVGKTTLLVVIGYACMRWWSQVMGGMEPGGQAHVAQRMLAARSEKDAFLGSLWFSFANFVIKPLPWIITALATLIIFPLDQFTDHERVFLSTISFVPVGLRGLVVASLIAAFMSTVDTRINLGASYFVNDFYKPFLFSEKSEEHYIAVSRWITGVQLVVSYLLLFVVSDMTSVFFIYAGLGSGAGLVYILRFYWSRISAWSEFAAMSAAFITMIIFRWGIYGSEAEFNKHGFDYMFISFFIVTAVWVLVTFITRPCERETLKNFYRRVKPPGPFWKSVSTELERQEAVKPQESLKIAFIGWVSANLMILGFFLGIGYLLTIRPMVGIVWLMVGFACTIVCAWSVRTIMAAPADKSG